MRSAKNFIGDFDSSFLSCEKDTELIIRKLFADSRPYSDELKRLLLINTKDCLDDRTNQAYIKKIDSTSIADLIDEGYVRIKPKLEFGENQEIMSYLNISFDTFVPNASNPHYRDCIVMIDILCHMDAWDLGNFRLRPFKIAGYIDGILNNTKLTGIGLFEFVGCNEIVLSENFAGYCLMYRAVHGEDDMIEPEDE